MTKTRKEHTWWDRDPERDAGKAPTRDETHYHGWTIHSGGKSMFMVMLRFGTRQAARQYFLRKGKSMGTEVRVFKCTGKCPAGDGEGNQWSSRNRGLTPESPDWKSATA